MREGLMCGADLRELAWGLRERLHDLEVGWKI